MPRASDMDRLQQKRYNPLDRETFEAIAYSAVGRASEVGPYPAYGLVHSTGQSGWSVGLIQWDMGQLGRRAAAQVFLDQYQAMAHPRDRYDQEGYKRVLTALQTPGNPKSLTALDQDRLNSYFRTEQGRASVDAFCQKQMEMKWESIGKPLARTKWLQDLANTDPGQATEIVAMATKMFNQGEVRGQRLVNRITSAPITPDGIGQWLETHEYPKVKLASGRDAYRSGQAAARTGARLFHALETSDGPLGNAWKQQVHGKHNPSLLTELKTDPELQLFDMMFRNPQKGRAILDIVDKQLPSRNISIAPRSPARFEAARIRLMEDRTLHIESPSGHVHELDTSSRSERHVPQVEQSTSDLRAPSHPGHPRYREAFAGVARLDHSLGRASDAGSERVAASLVAACAHLERIDRVCLSEDGRRIFGLQDGQHGGMRKMGVVDTGIAINQPFETSSRQWEANHARDVHQPGVPSRVQAAPTRAATFAPVMGS